MELESMAKLLMALRIACVIAGLVVISGIILFFVSAWISSIYEDWKWRRIRKRIKNGKKKTKE